MHLLVYIKSNNGNIDSNRESINARQLYTD